MVYKNHPTKVNKSGKNAYDKARAQLERGLSNGFSMHKRAQNL